MRLILDANLSPKRMGSVLKRAGHDVLSLASDPTVGALDDAQVLELAAEQDRILMTRNSRRLRSSATGMERGGPSPRRLYLDLDDRSP